MPRSIHGGRHELGQNFLTHTPTIDKITALTAETEGEILELGAGDGALTKRLATLARPITAIEIDERRVKRLQSHLPNVTVERADALRFPLTLPVVVGNIPFHLTTPILRRLLVTGSWRHAVLLTQWEVARKRAGIGGSTMMTAQAAPWFTFTLHGKVPSWGFTPRPSVDGGIIQITRRSVPLVSLHERTGYERFVRDVFTGRGGTLERILQRATRARSRSVTQSLRFAGVKPRALPRDLRAEQWAHLWNELR